MAQKEVQRSTDNTDLSINKNSTDCDVDNCDVNDSLTDKVLMEDIVPVKKQKVSLWRKVSSKTESEVSNKPQNNSDNVVSSTESKCPFDIEEDELQLLLSAPWSSQCTESQTPGTVSNVCTEGQSIITSPSDCSQSLNDSLNQLLSNKSNNTALSQIRRKSNSKIQSFSFSSDDDDDLIRDSLNNSKSGSSLKKDSGLSSTIWSKGTDLRHMTPKVQGDVVNLSKMTPKLVKSCSKVTDMRNKTPKLLNIQHSSHTTPKLLGEVTGSCKMTPKLVKPLSKVTGSGNKLQSDVTNSGKLTPTIAKSLSEITDVSSKTPSHTTPKSQTIEGKLKGIVIKSTASGLKFIP